MEKQNKIVKIKIIKKQKFIPNDILIKNKSPLRYPGGKTRACNILDSIINNYFDIKHFDTILSPFFGGGSFEFFFQNKYKIYIICNDKFKPLYNFWKYTKINKNKLSNEIEPFLGISKEQFTDLRKQIISLEDKFIQARNYFIINRCSFSGATLSGGFSKEASTKRFTSSSIQRIRNLNLQYFEIYNLDFTSFIQKYRKEKSLMFLDPPYYLEKKSKLYGNNGDLHENFDHIKLYEKIKNIPNWILTYNDCKYIRNLYKDFIIIDTSWSYGMNKTKKSSEIIIINN